jgi:biopolymer transport protein TolQ
MAVLVGMSVVSWAAYVSRRAAVARLITESRRAREHFLSASDTEAFAQRCAALADGPVPRLFFEAHQQHVALAEGVARKGGGWDAVRSAAGRELLTRTLASARSREILAARRGLILLATIGATAPFVGLFGTVWGIVKAFGAIGATRSADLATVAPGISEALIATAAGLVAAIPAVWFFNALSGQVRGLAAELERFAVEFLNAWDRAVAGGD